MFAGITIHQMVFETESFLSFFYQTHAMIHLKLKKESSFLTPWLRTSRRHSGVFAVNL